MHYKLSLLIRHAIGFLLLFSVATVYYTMIVLNDYDIIMQEDGPTLEDKYE